MPFKIYITKPSFFLNAEGVRAYWNMAIKKDKSGYRVFDRWISFPDFQLVRPMPTTDKSSKKILDKIRSFALDYCDFSTRVRTASDVTDNCRESLERTGFDFKHGIYMTESDNGAFAAVKFGTRHVEDGLRILFSHNDSPGLKLKAKPIILPWDPDKQEVHLGVELDLTQVGPIQAPQWHGHDYIVKGHFFRNGEKQPIEFRAYMPDSNIHTDTRLEEGAGLGESYPAEGLDLVPGYSSIRNFLNAIGLKSETEFQTAKLQVFPDTPTRLFGEGFISGYAHDARIGTFSTLRAFEQTKSPYTTILIGFDREEIGSEGPGGANSTFLEEIIDETLLKSGTVSSRRELTGSLRRELYKRSLAINGDVDVSGSNKDEEGYRIDFTGIAKMAFGPFLLTEDNEGDQYTRKEISAVMDILRNANVPFYPIANSMTQGNIQVETFGKYISRRGISTFAFGVPVAGTHSVIELAHEGDLYYSYLGNKAFLKADWKAK